MRQNPADSIVQSLELRFTSAADSDYNDIDFYSTFHWGGYHSAACTDELLPVIDNLLYFPHSGVARPDIGDGVRCVTFKGLVVLYRSYDTLIRILRIVNDRRDLRSFLAQPWEP